MLVVSGATMMDVAIEKRSQLLPPDTQSLTNLLVAKLHGTSDVRYSGKEWMIATEVELPTRDRGARRCLGSSQELEQLRASCSRGEGVSFGLLCRREQGEVS